MAVIVVFCVACAVTDWRSREIPNWLTGPAILLGFFLCSWPASIQGFGLALLIHLPFFVLRYTSGGDVKLMAALGALMGHPAWLTFFVLQAILGGIVALFVSLHRGRFGQTLRRTLRLGEKPLAVDDPAAITIPRGVVALGGLGLWFLAQK
jgi:prepilin peptidase CpaA